MYESYVNLEFGSSGSSSDVDLVASSIQDDTTASTLLDDSYSGTDMDTLSSISNSIAIFANGQRQEQENSESSETPRYPLSLTESTTASAANMSSADLSLRPSMVGSLILSESTDGSFHSNSMNNADSSNLTYDRETEEEQSTTTASLSTKSSGTSATLKSSDNNLPSASFLNVGSHLLSSNTRNRNENVLPAAASMELLDTDASTALAIALLSHEAPDQNNQKLFPSPIPIPQEKNYSESISLKQSYTCGLCNELIVAACILDCATGESQAFCTPCIERYENPKVCFEDKGGNEKDGLKKVDNDWILLSSNTNENDDLKKGGQRKKIDISSLLSKCFISSSSSSAQANGRPHRKVCPVSHKPYSRYIPCRSLDVAISSFVHQAAQQSKSNNSEKDPERDLDANSISSAEVDRYLHRLKQWNKEVEFRRHFMEQEKIQDVIKAQEAEMQMWNNKKEAWRHVLGTATTTLAMVVLSLLVGGRRQA